MKRGQRIEGYRSGLAGTERERAAQAQVADQRLRDARTRLQELEQYRRDYETALGRRVAGGMGGPALRDSERSSRSGASKSSSLTRAAPRHVPPRTGAATPRR